MIIDNNRKFVFIAVAKTGSTSITRRLGIFKDPIPKYYHMHLKDIVDRYDVKSYYKFAFVRNPYDRLVSLYYDLKQSKGHLRWSYPILKYKNFHDFVLNLPESPCLNFIHLRPQFEYLQINGEVNIDFIGRFENLIEDFKIIEKKLSLNHEQLPHYRKRETSLNNNFQSALHAKIIKFIKIKMLKKNPENWEDEYTESTKNIVKMIYKKDFEVFGYEK